MTNEIVDDNPSLSHKHKLFCLEMLKDFNITRSAIAVGYSEQSASTQGHQIMSLPRVKKYLAELIEKQFNDSQITVKQVLENIIEVHAIALQKKKVMIKVPKLVDMLDKDGQPVLYSRGKNKGKPKQELKYIREEDYTPYNPLAALKATEMLGKYLKMRADAQPINNTNIYAVVQKVVKMPEKVERLTAFEEQPIIEANPNQSLVRQNSSNELPSIVISKPKKSSGGK